MINYRDITIILKDKYYETIGLSSLIQNEIKLLINRRSENEYINVLTYIINYLIDSNAIVKENQTIIYHSWLLKFVKGETSVYKIHEINNTGENFIEGADIAIDIIDQQTNRCLKYQAPPLFPLFSQKIVISDGVLKGLCVDAVRYQSPDHMTGWWLTTDLYDDNVDSLIVIDYFDLAFMRQDLIQYLALPFGFRFNTCEEDVWFEEE